MNKIIDHIRYTFYIRYAKSGKIKVRSPYWTYIFIRQKNGTWSNGTFEPQIYLTLELESIYQSVNKSTNKQM